jgi:hypothetical protein
LRDFESGNMTPFALRAERYFSGLCISCGGPDAQHRLHPHAAMQDAVTHCSHCAGLELAFRKQSRDPATFTIMCNLIEENK